MRRDFILDTAREATMGDRNRTHGDPMDNLGLAGELKVLFRTYARKAMRPISAAEQEAIDLCLTKISRIAVGSLNPDNYIDLAAYAAIAGEAATRSAINEAEKERRVPRHGE